MEIYEKYLIKGYLPDFYKKLICTFDKYKIKHSKFGYLVWFGNISFYIYDYDIYVCLDIIRPFGYSLYFILSEIGIQPKPLIKEELIYITQMNIENGLKSKLINVFAMKQIIILKEQFNIIDNKHIPMLDAIENIKY